MLRDSSSRFFSPQYSGNTHEYRQNVIVNEGILQPKYTSILQLGKKDMLSYGVEEQFSKSEYTSKSIIAKTGLVESRQPGAFTPRKQFMAASGGGGVAECLSHLTANHTSYNPSGDPRVLSKWGKGIDLDVRASASTLPSSSIFGGATMSQSTLQTGNFNFSQPLASSHSNRVISNVF